MTIGVLPAAGTASRINGLPKFLLPIRNDLSLIQWHVNLMNEACSSVRVSTRLKWINAVSDLHLEAKTQVDVPSTMATAVDKLYFDNRGEDLMIGMPDIYIHNSTNNFYADMLESDGDIVLATWEYMPKMMQGKIGQVLADSDGNVLSVVDKDPECTYPEMWGALLFRRHTFNRVDLKGASVLSSVNEWIAQGVKVKRVKMTGEYIDAGTIEGLAYMYKRIEESNGSK